MVKLLIPIFAACTTLLDATAALGDLCYKCPGSQAKSAYPNKCEIANIFAPLNTNDTTAFWKHVSPTVHWTLMGTHPLAGSYHNRTVFLVDTIERLAEAVDTSKPHELKLTNVIGGVDDEWSTQELHGIAILKNGGIYDNRFNWNTRWDKNGTIVEVRAFFDSNLVNKVITEYESGLSNYTIARTKLMPGPVCPGSS